MSKYRKILVTVLSALLIVVAALGIAACNKDKTDYYKIDTVCEAAQGEITVTAPKAKEGYVKDEEVTATVTAKTGYTLNTFTVNDTAAQLTEGKYTFKVQGNTTLKATFTSDAPATFTVTVTEGEGGSVTLSPEGTKNGNVYTYNKDTVVTVTVTPDVLKVLDSFKVDGAEKTLTADNTYSLTVTANTTIAATFKDKTTASEHALHLDESYYGTYDFLTNDEPDPEEDPIIVTSIGVFWGDSEILLSEDDEGGETQWTVEIEGTEGTWTFAFTGGGYLLLMYNGDTSGLEYNFKLENSSAATYTVTLTYDNSQGTVTIDPEKTAYTVGETVSIMVIANSGYEIESVLVGGEPISLDGYMFTFEVRYDIEVVVTFVPAETPTELQGTWNNLNGSNDTFKIEARKATWKGKEYSLDSVTENEVYGNPDAVSYNVSFTYLDASDPNAYPENLEVTLATVGNAFMVYDAEGNTCIYYKGNGLTYPTASRGTYTSIEDDEALTITETTATVGSNSSSLYGDGNGIYWVKLGGVSRIELNENMVTISPLDESGDKNYVSNTPVFSFFPNAIVGEWTGSDSDDSKFTIASNGTVTWTNTEYSWKLISVSYDGMLNLTGILTKGDKSVRSNTVIQVTLDGTNLELTFDISLADFVDGGVGGPDIGLDIDEGVADPDIGADPGLGEGGAEGPVTSYTFTKTVAVTKLTSITGLEEGTYQYDGLYYPNYDSFVVADGSITAINYSGENDIYVLNNDNGTYIVYIGGSLYKLRVSEGNIVVNNGYSDLTYSILEEPAPTEPAV